MYLPEVWIAAELTAASGDTTHMRALEIIVGLIVAAILFVVLEVIGIVIKFALIAAVAGFVAGALVTMMFRSRSS
jgi:membrane associated rhomboid family serine protease